MDLIAIALIAGLAFWVGSAFGYEQGVVAGKDESRIRRRLRELGK
jgi:hypothetical protein